MAEGESPDMFVDDEEEPMEIIVTNKDVIGNSAICLEFSVCNTCHVLIVCL